MLAEKNVYVPDELLAEVERMAQSQGRSTDELAADALERYMAHELLKTLSQGAEERRADAGLETDDDVERYVNDVIHQHRKEQSSS